MPDAGRWAVVPGAEPDACGVLRRHDLEVTYLNLVERGIRFHDLACDGGTGLRASVREAELAISLCPDSFHLLQKAHRLTRRLASAAYQTMETAERARRAALEADGIINKGLCGDGPGTAQGA